MRLAVGVGVGSRRRRVAMHRLLLATAIFTFSGLLILTLRSVDPSTDIPVKSAAADADADGTEPSRLNKTCATVEEMGEVFSRGIREEGLRVRKIIEHHFAINGAARVRKLSPEEFCRHGFVLGKASEAGFGNEMYKILTGAALSVILNRSLIIGQTRHIGESILSGNSFLTPMLASP